MNQDVEKYCDDMDDMFASAGWKHLSEQVLDDINNQLSLLSGVSSWDAACRIQGRISTLSEILNLPSTVDHIRKGNNDADV